MKKFSLSNMHRFCLGILLFFATAIALCITYFSLIYSYRSFEDCDPTVIVADLWWVHLIAFALCVTAAWGLDKWLNHLGSRRRYIEYGILGIVCLVFVILCTIWVVSVPYTPLGDQLCVSAAAHYNLHGNMIMLIKGGYIGIYSHQKGLMFIYELFYILFGDFCYNVIEKFHIGMGVITILAGYSFVKDTTKKSSCALMYSFLVLTCLPYIIYMLYIYGDLPSICFCVLLFWALNRYSRSMQRRYVVLSCFSAILALFFRTNSWIVLIAVCIGLFLLALERRTIRPVIAAACIVLSGALSLHALDVSYEIRSGYENTHGTPASLYIAMGLQPSENGPGVYNYYHQYTYASVEFDRDRAEELGWNEVEHRLEIFRADPAMAMNFFKIKIQMQWIDPMYESIIHTYSFNEEQPFPDWIWEFYNGSVHPWLFHFSNSHQSVVYLSFLALVLVLWRKPQGSTFYIPLISIVGGFLFCIIWESKSRYMFPYYMFMLLYAPYGLSIVGEWTRKIGEKIKLKLNRQ